MAPSLGARIRARRDAVGLTQEKLATACGVSRAAVAQWEAGVTRPSLDNLVKAADALSVWLSWLTTGDQSLPGGTNPFAAAAHRTLPIIDFAVAGRAEHPGHAVSASDVPVVAVDSGLSSRAFALVIRDGSMAAEFAAGDTIIIDPDIEPLPGDFVLARIDRDTEATFRKFRPRGADSDYGTAVELAPLNPDWPTRSIDAENPGRILGTLVEHRRYRRVPQLG
jgi:SOS-response transcriptional repressor LexA